jgi:NADPH oxidase 1
VTPIRVDGPYGAPAQDVFDNDIAVLVGAGIGVTPWASVLRSLWFWRPQRLRRVEFIWICKETASFAWLQTSLVSLEDRLIESNESQLLRVHIYLTEPVNADTTANLYLNSLGAQRDPITALRTGTSYGRPNFKTILHQVQREAESQTYLTGLESQLRTRIGVYCCGPRGLARTLQQACGECSTSKIKFRFAKEEF